jgi:beta-glucosidase
VYQNENGDVADDSYNKWKTDIQLMTDMKGLNAFRLSIAWGRIIQLDGTVNPAGIAHYNALIGEKA